jgi:hypothetical protein
LILDEGAGVERERREGVERARESVESRADQDKGLLLGNFLVQKNS